MSDPELDAVLDDETEEPEAKDAESVEAEAEVSEQEKPEPTVPVSVLTAERAESRRRMDYLEGQLRKPDTPKADPVDFLAEPEKIEALINQKVAQAAQALSERLAVRQHGRKTVDEAYAALRDHGTQAEQQATSASVDPWGDAVEWHQRREAMAEIGNDPAAWRKAETARITKDLLAKAAVRQVKGEMPDAVSLADSPNLGTRADKTEEPDDSLEALLD